jgi:hypothetical protein
VFGDLVGDGRRQLVRVRARVGETADQWMAAITRGVSGMGMLDWKSTSTGSSWNIAVGPTNGMAGHDMKPGRQSRQTGGPSLEAPAYEILRTAEGPTGA